MSTPLITVKPATPGIFVRKENGEHLALEGEEVTRSAFWSRRLSDGDVVEVKPTRTKSKIAKPEQGE